MPWAPKLSAMCRAGTQPCERALGGEASRPRKTPRPPMQDVVRAQNDEFRMKVCFV
jgi:hypothetical protein